MSDHAIEIVEVTAVRPHPNADRLELVPIWGWQAVVRKGEFKPGDRAVYIPPDFLVRTDRPEFEFLGPGKGDPPQARIKACRLRGELSQGLLIPLPEGCKEFPRGHDVSGILQIERYEPPLKMGTNQGNAVKAPPIGSKGGPAGVSPPKFDVENWERWNEVLELGEMVTITEKIHGANARFVYVVRKDGTAEMFCGSRTNWWEENPQNLWWQAFAQNPGIGEWCKAHPGVVLYGEVFGAVQDMRYGAKDKQVFFAAFAAYDPDIATAMLIGTGHSDPSDAWWDFKMLRESMVGLQIGTVPVLWAGPYDPKKVEEYCEGESHWPGADHFREGCVVLPDVERHHKKLGRVILKKVSTTYLARKE